MEFYVDLVQNRSEIVNRGFLKMHNTNITTPRVSEVPEAHSGPLLLEFNVNFLQNRSEIIASGF